MDMGISYLSDLCSSAMVSANVNEVLQSLVINGIFVGVGSVFKFFFTYYSCFVFSSYQY